ncbi:MAG: RHS repeat protein [Opitutae bacterium]|nr:RHS repeat protein [Opitutae bacterium]
MRRARALSEEPGSERSAMKVFACVFFVVASVFSAWAQIKWDPDAPTTHRLTLPDGDYVEITVQGLSHIIFNHAGTHWEHSPHPKKVSLLTAWGHYSNKEEPYVISGQVIPGSGSREGWFRANSLLLYVYTNCSGSQAWMNYTSTNALPIWKPEQSGVLRLTGSGSYLPECHQNLELAKLVFQGSEPEVGIVREIFVDLKKGRPVPAAPPDEPGDPDFEFRLDYNDRHTEPPGEDWPPLADDWPPYDDYEGGDPGEPENSRSGFGSCSPYGMPVYRVDASDLTLEIADRMFAYRTLGPDVAYTHTYRSKKASTGMFGSRWYFSYEQKVVPLFPGRVLRGDLLLSSWVNTNVTPPAANVHLGKGRPSKFVYIGTNAAGEKAYAPLDPFMRAELVLLPDAWELRNKKPRWTHRFERAASYITYPLGRLTSISDPFGNAMTFSYRSNTNASERAFWLIGEITDAASRVTSFDYNDENLCSRITMPNGLFAAYAYDTNACLAETTDLLGSTTTYVYGNTLQTLDRMESAGKTVRFTYDSKRRIATLADPLGQTNAYQVPRTNVTRFTSAAGYSRETAVNTVGLPSAASNALGQTATLLYNADNRPTQATRTGNRMVSVAYDAAGNRTRHQNPVGAVTARAFDEKNRLVAATNALGHVLRFTYSSRDQLLSMTHPSGARVSYGYLSNGLLAAMTNEVGAVTRYEYDAFGNLARVVDPVGAVTAYRYDPHGLLVTNVVNPNGHATAYAYDANGRMTQVRFADNTSQTFHYDCCALTGITDPFGRFIPVGRDANLYVTNFAAPSGASPAFSYDADGRQTNILHSAGVSSSARFDDLGRPSALVTPAGTLSFTYDDMWNIAIITNPAGHAWRYAYDDARQLIAETDPLGRTTAHARDLLGRLVATTNANGTTVTQTYNQDGRPDTLTVGDAGIYRIEYNAAGWVTAQHTPLGTTRFSYDAAGRVTRLDYPGGLAIQKTYDPNGNLSSLAYPDGTTANCQYDARERLTHLIWNNGSVGLAYDAASRLIALQRGNGATTTIQRTPGGQVTGLIHAAQSGPIARIGLTRDALGRLTRSDVQNSALPATDVTGEPTAAMTYNAADGLANLAGSAVQSDLNGNLTAIPALGASYAYDALNRVTSLATPEGTTTLAYDSMNRVIRLQTPEKTRRFFYDERSRLLFATDDAHHVVWINLFAGHMLLARSVPNGDTQYYHYSALGHTLALTDGDGSLSGAFSYTPFGMSSQAHQADREWFTLSGSFAVLDLGRGHHLMRNRLYNAALGRFLQRDPLGLAAGANLYAYTGSDPVNAIDPFGLSSFAYDDMDLLREEYNNRLERDKARQRQYESDRDLILRAYKEDQAHQQWNKNNPIKAWLAEQIIDKMMSYSTGGFTEFLDSYYKYQRGEYFNMIVDRVPVVGEVKHLLENLYNSDVLPPPTIKPPPSGGGLNRNWNNLGGAGGPQCLMENRLYE